MAKTQRLVVLLRGINVGGKNKLPMADLRAICEGLGCTDVTTYIQSGNVVLSTALSPAKLGTSLERAIGERFPFAPKIVTRTRADLDRVVDANPFPDAEERFLHVGFLSKKPTKAAAAKVADLDVAPEAYRLIGSELFLDYVNGAGRSEKLGKVKFEKLLGVDITARNWRSVLKLQSMA